MNIARPAPEIAGGELRYLLWLAIVIIGQAVGRLNDAPAVISRNRWEASRAIVAPTMTSWQTRSVLLLCCNKNLYDRLVRMCCLTSFTCFLLLLCSSTIFPSFFKIYFIYFYLFGYGLMPPLAAYHCNSWRVLSMLCTWQINSLSLSLYILNILPFLLLCHTDGQLISVAKHRSDSTMHTICPGNNSICFRDVHTDRRPMMNFFHRSDVCTCTHTHTHTHTFITCTIARVEMPFL